ncbi:MAG: hypothetical protein WCL54_05405 [Clostridia bacterium]
MPTNKLLKIAGLNAGIAIGNTVLFSPGLLALQIGGASVLGTAFGVTAIFMSIVLFGYGNYKLLTEEPKAQLIQTGQIKTTEEFIEALQANSGKKTFQKDIQVMLDQIQRFHKKRETIQSILLQKFNAGELSFQKFESTISAVEEVFYVNIRSILNRLNAFDEVDYNEVKKNEVLTSDVLQGKKAILEEYISFVKDAINDNEEIILKLDRLLLEISKLNSLESGEIEKMSIMSEIDDLIGQTKFYKDKINIGGR